MQQYLDLLKHILDKGEKKSNRTGINTISIFGYQMRFDLSKGFPLLTTKKVNFASIAHELLWFLKGDTNIKYLVDNNVNIWNEWAYEYYLKKNSLQQTYVRYSDGWRTHMKEFVRRIKTDDSFAKEYGELKGVYGKQWTRWECKNGKTINQIEQVVNLIKNEPNSRRILVNAWNVDDVNQSIQDPDAAPIGCHTVFQFIVVNNKLSCQLYQRSADTFLGVPFNIASYALLTKMVAQVCKLEVGEFIHTFGDAHIYEFHNEQVGLQLSREPRKLPQLDINPNVESIFGFKYSDFELTEYDPHPAIKGDIAV